jgi:hypothetical protein
MMIWSVAKRFRFIHESSCSTFLYQKGLNLKITQFRGKGYINYLCPQCREELGVMNILGFD